MTLPPVELLSGAGIGFVASFALWEAKLAPALRRRRVRPAPSAG